MESGDNRKERYWTGFMDPDPCKHRILIPIRITNPFNEKSVMRDALVDTGFANNLMMDHATAKQLELDPRHYDFHDRTANSASGEMIIQQSSRGKLQISIPIIKISAPETVFSAEHELKGFATCKDWESPKVVLGLAALQVMKLEAVFFRRKPEYKVSDRKTVSKICGNEMVMEWNYGYEGTQFFKQIGIVPPTEEEMDAFERMDKERKRARRAKLTQLNKKDL